MEHFYIDNLEYDVQQILEKQTNIYKNIKIKKGERNSFDADKFKNFQNYFRKTLYELDSALSYWESVFENEQTLDEKTLRNNNFQHKLNVATQQRIISNYIFNNFFTTDS